MTFGEKLKLLRKERGLTQSEVAAAVGQERSTIACWESDKRLPAMNVIEKLANLFHVTLDYFSDKSEEDLMIELLARSNSFFSANNISEKDKVRVYREIMRLYLENTQNEESNTRNDKNSKTNPSREANEG